MYLFFLKEAGVALLPSLPFLLMGGHGGQPAIIASPLPHSRNLTAFTRGAKELLLRDLDQLFLSSDCRHVNRTESLRCGGFTAGTSSLSFRSPSTDGLAVLFC